jgi:hypothetical protein
MLREQLETIDLDALRASKGYWYLATPYSKYPGGIRQAYIEACRAAAWLLRQGVMVFCPIAHSHPIAVYGEIDPLDHGVWIPADTPIMRKATGLIIAMMPTWQESYGIRVERAEFGLAGKPIEHMRWPR